MCISCYSETGPDRLCWHRRDGKKFASVEHCCVWKLGNKKMRVILCISFLPSVHSHFLSSVCAVADLPWGKITNSIRTLYTYSRSFKTTQNSINSFSHSSCTLLRCVRAWYHVQVVTEVRCFFFLRIRSSLRSHANIESESLFSGSRVSALSCWKSIIWSTNNRVKYKLVQPLNGITVVSLTAHLFGFPPILRRLMFFSTLSFPRFATSAQVFYSFSRPFIAFFLCFSHDVISSLCHKCLGFLMKKKTFGKNKSHSLPSSLPTSNFSQCDSRSNSTRKLYNQVFIFFLPIFFVFQTITLFYDSLFGERVRSYIVWIVFLVRSELNRFLNDNSKYPIRCRSHGPVLDGFVMSRRRKIDESSGMTDLLACCSFCLALEIVC